MPEFNAGAMENPGCVTFRDTMVFRGAATPDEVLQRSNTIAHEMAHMWFGDLVTMHWWDDLWLNESFAEYMAYEALTEVTEFTDAWVEFGVIRKMWGYAAERAPSTHPVAGSPAPDAHSALGNFDGISYAKGASVLRQLIAHIGDDAFLRGVTAHLSTNEFGNGDLAEFLAAMEQASGRSLAAWSSAWLETAGADRLTLEGDVLVRTAPSDHPVERPHTVDVAVFVGRGRGLAGARRRRRRPHAGARPGRVPPRPSSSPMPVTSPGPRCRSIPARSTTSSAGSTTSRTCRPAPCCGWPCSAAVHRAEVDPRHALDVFCTAWPRRDRLGGAGPVRARRHQRDRADVPPPGRAAGGAARVADAADELLDRSAAVPGTEGDALAVLAARVWARSGSDIDRLRRWSRGEGLPSVLVADDDFRWTVLRRLATLGELSDAEIEAAEAAPTARSRASSPRSASARSVPRPRPRSGHGPRFATTSPSPTTPRSRSPAVSGWRRPTTSSAPISTASVTSSSDCPAGWVTTPCRGSSTAIHPTTLVEEDTAVVSAAVLERGDLTPGVRRALVDADHALREALASRRRFG